ncbi:MAG: GntR family transcriptional regulator [Betaproteobacteria bacterium]|nr:GntR family transcriptional regulator [Betaproteobacteria bacterium]MDH3437982.1 GntR family transcriptional regulator [Betaproteobacteria bacterium]
MRARKAGRITPQVSARVAEHIERLISEGSVAAGNRINEAALAERLGVSRAPVREALRGLEGKGLLTKIANRGTFVRELSVKEMLDIFDMRALLMGYGAERATELLNEERKRVLARLLDQMDRVAKAHDGTRYYRLNLEFHTAIITFSNNRRAARVYEELAKDLFRFRRNYFDFSPNMARSNAEHRAVYDAMVTGNEREARRLAEEHVQRGKIRVLQTIGP